MNTLKSYLESMFAKLPNTREVLRAKDELWQMMEDKYMELIAEGKNENEAVGTVISEFGNLEELSGVLGLEKAFSYQPSEDDTAGDEGMGIYDRQPLPFEEAKQYVDELIRQGFFVSIGVMLCIFSVIWPILSETFNWSQAFGVTGMMLFIAAAVFLFVYSGIMMGKWDYIKNGNYIIDFDTAKVMQNEQSRFHKDYAVRLTIGIVLCVLCWLPSMVISETALGRIDQFENMGAVFLFIIVGIGVMMIVYSSMTMEAYKRILKINDSRLVSGNYVNNQGKERYINSTVETIMSLYWPTITSAYLIWSFLTFDWHLTWIIWPIAGIISGVIKANLTVKE